MGGERSRREYWEARSRAERERRARAAILNARACDRAMVWFAGEGWREVELPPVEDEGES